MNDPHTPKPTHKGRPKKATPERLGEGVRFRLTASERAAIEGRAAEAGLSLSDYCRQAALTGRVTVRGNSGVPMGVIGQLRRLGNNLNQVLKEARQNNFPAHLGDEAEAALREISAYLRGAFHDSED